MIVLICGSRYWTDEATIRSAIEQLPPKCTVVHGNSRGADKIGGRISKELGHTVVPVPAEWTKYRKAAGPIRNRKMLKDHSPELVLAFQKSGSRGTQDMMDIARKSGVKVMLWQT